MTESDTPPQDAAVSYAGKPSIRAPWRSIVRADARGVVPPIFVLLLTILFGGALQHGWIVSAWVLGVIAFFFAAWQTHTMGAWEGRPHTTIRCTLMFFAQMILLGTCVPMLIRLKDFPLGLRGALLGTGAAAVCGLCYAAYVRYGPRD